MTRFIPGPDTARDFRQALGQFTTGITIVTCRHESRPLGLVANSFASVSLDPPLVLWSPARSSRRFAAFEAAERFAIHVLGTHQHAFCKAFMEDGTRPFDDLEWHEAEGGVPVIDTSLAHFECRRHAVHEGGDHAIIVGYVTAAAISDGAPLLFSKGSYGRFTDLG